MSHCNELYSITAQAENGVNQFDRMDFDASSKSKNSAIFDKNDIKALIAELREMSDEMRGFIVKYKDA